MIDKFEKTFDGYMKDLLQLLMQQRRYQSHIANLAQRLDYNGFYSRMYLDSGKGGVGTDFIQLNTQN